MNIRKEADGKKFDLKYGSFEDEASVLSVEAEENVVLDEPRIVLQLGERDVTFDNAEVDDDTSFIGLFCANEKVTFQSHLSEPGGDIGLHQPGFEELAQLLCCYQP